MCSEADRLKKVAECRVRAMRKRFEPGIEGFTINRALLGLAEPDAIVLHCLPAHYGEEIEYEASRGSGSAIFDQAENRMHAQKAVMALLMS